LSHPNVVSVLDFGEDDECAWIVMELVDGETLRALLDRGVRLDTPAIVQLMGQILSALGYTHSRGVVHRDIKPENIMLTRDRVAKITDFGIARIEDASMMVVGTMLGSPAYMAPEQVLCENVDHRADLWAAGVILYQLLTGERPFEGSRTTVGHKVLYAEPVLPSRTRAAVPAQFDAVVARALAKQPEARFSSAAEFADALRAAAAEAGTRPAAARPEAPGGRRGPPPPLARPLPPPRRGFGRWVLPVALGGAAAVVTAVVVVLALPEPRPDAPIRTSNAPPPIAGPAPGREPAVPPPDTRPPPGDLAVLQPVPALPAQPSVPSLERTQDPPPPPDYRPAAAEALAAFRCGVVSAAGGMESVTLRGFAPFAEIQSAQRSLAAAGVPTRLQLDTIGNLYCGALTAARPYMEETGWQAGLDGPSRLSPGQVLRVRVQLPDWPAHVYLGFLMTTGDVAHLASTPQRQSARGRLLLTDPTWEMVGPPATEVLLVVASDRPLFPHPRPSRVERLDEFAAALGPALRAVRDGGGRVAAQAFVVQTVPR
ncbi:serine/threonine-protein kinase, partial [Paracraurococcus lichenis]